jgi:hypothetical protein
VTVTRPALCLALACSLAGAGAANAAVKPKPKKVAPVCNLVTDPAGDASALGVGDPSSDALDILSADVSTGAKTVKAVIRVKSLAGDPMSQQGYEFKFIWAVKGAFSYLRVQSTPGLGESYDYGTQADASASSTSLGTASGSIDKAKGTITMTIDKAAVGIKKGAKLTDLTARSYISAVALYEGWDDAVGSKAYVDGTPSCIGSA